MEDGRRHAGGGATDTLVAGHVTVRTAQCATIAALHQPICSPAAAREGHQWIDRWQELGNYSRFLTLICEAKKRF